MPQASRNSQPRIGVTVEILEPPLYSGRRRYQLFTDYLACLREAGALPMLLPADADRNEAAQWLELLDGILLTGGDDVDLRTLGGPAPLEMCKPIPEPKLDLDLGLIQTACQRGLPLFGVCLGMQELGLAHSAPYVQHLDNASDHEKGVEHRIRPVPGTLLARLVGESEFTVPSFHHQALSGPGQGLVPSGWAEDGLLEAVERPDHPFALGVQWHPERAPDSEASRKLFSGFLDAAREYQQSA